MNKMWYLYTMEYYTVIECNETVPFAETWIDRECHTEGSKSEREKHISRKNGTDESVCRTGIQR